MLAIHLGDHKDKVSPESSELLCASAEGQEGGLLPAPQVETLSIPWRMANSATQGTSNCYGKQVPTEHFRRAGRQ